MGCLAWLLAMGGIGGASLAFALAAPGQAWWGLGLVVVALLAGPHVLQWWLGRARRTERLAARWWAAAPDPMEVAHICGGPDRVVDLVVADLVAEDRLTIDEEGRLGLVDGIGDAREETGFRREIHNRLSYGHTDLAALRFSARPATALQRLWRSAARQGLLLPGWRREYTHWYLAGAIVVVGYCVAIALGELQQRELDVDNVTFAVGLARLYSARWPQQENVIRDWLLPLGLDTNHGYAKQRATLEERRDRLQRWAASARVRYGRADRRADRCHAKRKERGEVLYRDGQVFGRPGSGEQLTRTPAPALAQAYDY